MTSKTFTSGTVIDSAWLNDVNTKTYLNTVHPKMYGGVGDGTTDDLAALKLAMESGKVVDLGGQTWAVSGTLQPTSFKGVINGVIKQLAPTTSNCKTLNIESFTDFVIDNLKIDRGGSAGYTVGALGTTGDWAGLRIKDCSDFTLGRIWITNGGRGSGIVLWNCTDYEAGRIFVDEHYWQEVNPAVPVVTDDVVQPWWINACTNFTMVGWRAKNCTSGVSGDPTVNVATSQVRNYSRCAWGGNSKFAVIGCNVENVAQCYDFTGSLGNSEGVIIGNIAIDAGVSGFKWANSSYSLTISNNIAKRPNQYGFLISGMTEVSNPVMRDFIISNCVVIDCGGLSTKYAGNNFAFAVESQAAVDVTYPRSVTFIGCQVIDRQGTPTTHRGFRTNVAAIAPTTTGYTLPHTIRCIECKVDVPGMAVASQYEGIAHPYAVIIGDGAGADAVANNTWTNVTFDATDLQDPSRIHGPSNLDAIYVKEPGMYIIKGRTAFPTNSSGNRAIRLTVNGGNVEDQSTVGAHATQPTHVWDTWMRYLYPGDILRLQAWQDSGGSLNITRSNNILSITKVF